MAVALTRGTTSVRERPDSPTWEYNTQKVTCTRLFEGMYADLLTTAPTIGSNMEGYSAQLLVENVRISKAVSGKATMTVVLETQTYTYSAAAPVQPVYEIEWTQLERPIEQSPFFKTLFPDPTGVVDLTKDQTDAITAFRAWENAPDAGTALTAYNALTPVGTDPPDSGSVNFKALALKKMRGETTYLLFAPVARITTLTRQVFPVTACGQLFATVPTFDELPGGYIWLQTADRSTRTGTYGKWQRVQEWTGADSWDKDLYFAVDF
jgi:hypothetical protein